MNIIFRFFLRLILVITACVARLFVGRDRIVVHDYRTQLMELIKCINLTENKRRKRLDRLQLAVQAIMAADLIAGGVPMEAVALIIANRAAVDRPNIINIDGLFDPSPPIWPTPDLYAVQPADPKIPFKQHCTSIFNRDGFIYMTTRYVAEIAYALFLISIYLFSSKHDWNLAKHSKLQFKGGAATGYMLLKFVKEKRQRDEIKRLFIIGSDNDTALHFHDDGKNFQATKNAFERLLESYINIYENVFNFFLIDKMFAHYERSIYANPLIINGQSYNLLPGSCRSFRNRPAFTVDNTEYTERNYTSNRPGRYYTTTSPLDFIQRSPDGNHRISFILGRVKMSVFIEKDDRITPTFCEVFDCVVPMPTSSCLLRDEAFMPFVGIGNMDVIKYAFGVCI